ncbi:hypothetical protein BJV85_002143 [Clostridium acetobutylicum]|uniref:Predicted membrane protein n=1 Tax=Clostridium acetobutylicum (strain ATCC 824 / DSM 792 / JCM 1419 / IAM 19013 / LMG 5710 / NBRC 13948 / NRRL B-527 / VKM B-1787 / 2291 / W) TaxID=272562 RepID=Q97I03_CLOAB|nr:MULTISPECIES: hypothetical protein [Clostridium]AAK79817.1 Predicted membrane protein [Clostridium acetobutylicum ATCC 824]ADZ20903.1 membrane protein [Clostridium acetobutylicum EA 2018]AEI31997.1 hypothetical protein SMB_G1878 [Clostridium acetobutylicum DSM 1731]AWV79750.1 hypothetical protein DK921_06495 [Clostridium acetobutylicum]MBC2394270.1 hypothetical protein [Clostridium acetobutylicum]
MKKSNVFLGGLLVLIGILAILHQFSYLGFISSRSMVGFLLLIIGVAFDLSYFIGKKNSSNLIAGGILLTLGIFYIGKSYFYLYALSAVTWQIYTFSIAVGLYQAYIFANKDKGTLIAATILTVVSIFSAVSNIFRIMMPIWFNRSFIFPIILILAGIYILFKNFRN